MINTTESAQNLSRVVPQTILNNSRDSQILLRIAKHAKLTTHVLIKIKGFQLQLDCGDITVTNILITKNRATGLSVVDHQGGTINISSNFTEKVFSIAT